MRSRSRSSGLPHLLRLLALAALASLAALTSACHRNTPEPGPAVTPDDAEAPPPPPPPLPAKKGPRRTGFVGMLFHAAGDLTLTGEQSSAIGEIEASLRTADDAAKGASRALQSDLAAGIRAGKIDAAKTRADYAALDAAAKQRTDRQAVALNALHAALDPAQRDDLSLAVRARQAAHALRPPDELDEVEGDWTQRRLDRLTDDLGLDAAQRQKVGALLAKSGLPDSAEMKARKDAATAHADEILRAFSRDEAFDATKLDLRVGASEGPHELVEREARFLGQLIVVLKPEQREKLAASRERHPEPVPE